MKYNEGFFPNQKIQPIFFRTWTPDKPKLTVIYLHGAGSNSSADCDVMARQLAKTEGFGFMAFDAPAQGYSQANPGTSALTVQRTVLSQLIRNAKTPTAVVASSAGAIAAFLCMHRHRDEPDFQRVPLVLAEPGLRFDVDTADLLKAAGPFFHGRHRTLEHAIRAYDAGPGGAILFDSEEAKIAFVASRLRVQDNALVSMAPRIDPQNIRPFDLLSDKEAIQNPSLVLWGEKAALKAKCEKELARVLPDQTVIDFPGAGHPLSLTRAVEIEPIAQFLRQHASA